LELPVDFANKDGGDGVEKLGEINSKLKEDEVLLGKVVWPIAPLKEIQRVNMKFLSYMKAIHIHLLPLGRYPC